MASLLSIDHLRQAALSVWAFLCLLVPGDGAVIVLRILNLGAWGAMLAYMIPGAWASAFGDARRGDPMRMGCAATAVVIIGFNLRALVGVDTWWSRDALLLLSAAVAIFILQLGRSYGRGPRL